MIAIRIVHMPDGTELPEGYYLREIHSDPVAQNGTIQGGALDEAQLFVSEEAASEYLHETAHRFPPIMSFGIALETPTLH